MNLATNISCAMFQLLAYCLCRDLLIASFRQLCSRLWQSDDREVMNKFAVTVPSLSHARGQPDRIYS